MKTDIDYRHLITVYCQRFQESTSDEQREFYRTEIIAMQQELDIQESIEELIDESKPFEVTTDDWSTIERLQVDRTVMITCLDWTWSWRFFRFMWYVRFYNKHK